MKKKLLFLMLITAFNVADLFALDVSIGIKGNFAVNWAWNSPGEYGFTNIQGTATNNNAARRSVGQAPLMGGGAALFTQLGFTGWYRLNSEVGFYFRNGISYQGNVSQSNLNKPQPGAPAMTDVKPLTGTINQTWNSIELHLINQFYPLDMGSSFRLFFAAGPSFSFIVGSMTEEFKPATLGVASNVTPYPAYNKKNVAAEHLYNVGVTAGLGIEMDAGPGFIVVDMRSTWYFLDNDATYVSMGEAIKTAKPLVINIGYAFRLN
jgi:outer membrane protein W